MRALGPGSVSSFLKIILEVVYVGLWVGVSVVSLLAVAALLLSFDPELLTSRIHISDAADEIARSGPLLAGGLAGMALYLGGLMIIVERLRRIFATLTAGDPFHPENVLRLRVVGLTLAGLECGRFLFSALVTWLAPGSKIIQGSFTLNTWFSVLVVFVLAEVFREGARLRREAELTI